MTSCTNNQNDSTPIIEADAILYGNNLPADGCAEHLSLVDDKGDEIQSLLPTAATMALFTNLLNSEAKGETYTGALRVPVRLKYKETQEKGELLCGWGTKLVVSEVEIISIKKR